MRRLWLMVLAFTLVLAACGGDDEDDTAQTTTTSPAGAAATATAAGGQAGGAATQRIGGTVSVLATWGSSEQESFLAMVKPFEERTGVKVEYEGTRDLGAVLTTRVEGGNPPDVAGLPNPGTMAELARSGKLIDLAGVLDTTAMRDQYSEEWLKLAQVDNKQVGIFIKAALKGPIWYNTKQFSTVSSTTPKTWDELMTLSEKIAESGTTPWCIGLESAATSGWPGTDWLENIVLRQAGPDAYERWHRGELKWTSAEIKRAWETWGRIVGNERMVYGGRQTMLATNFGEAGNPLFDSPPRCYLHHQGSFITSFFVEANPNLKPVDDFNFFPFPEIESRYSGAVEVAGDMFGMFKDTPQARALMQYLTTPEAHEIWVKRGGAISPNKKVALNSYPDAISRQMAQTLVNASAPRFDASDLMPEAMNAAFQQAILEFVRSPGNLDSILSGLDRVQTDTSRR